MGQRKTFIICHRVEEIPFPRVSCALRICKCCEEEIWVPESDVIAAPLMNGVFVCLGCLAEALRQEGLTTEPNGFNTFTVLERTVH